MSNRMIYIGYYCEQSYFTNLIEVDKKKYSQARQNLEYSLLNGLSEYGDISIISYVPFSNTKSCPEQSFVDRLIINNICVSDGIIDIFKGAKSLYKMLKKADNGSRILMYAVNPMFVIPVFLLRRRKGFQVTTICSELPQYRRWKEKLKNRVKHALQAMLNKKFDKYILLTEKMKDVIPVISKPYMVMEGIYSGVYGEKKGYPHAKTVMYAGGLSEDNGIKLIINGFKKTDAEELWICGTGPLEEYIKAEAENDHRIKFFGMLPVEQVRKMELDAYILVCVRDYNNPMTLYSFPSKVLEYLASGTRVICSRLGGIPNEYYAYVVPINEYASDSIEEAINNSLVINKNEYVELSKRQIDYVRENKTAEHQGKRVYEFVMD